MNNEKFHLIDIVKEVILTLNSQNIIYALSGALANIAWGIPRATQDIDILISVSKIQLPVLLGKLFSLGFKGDLKELTVKAQKDYFIRMEYNIFILELFLPAIPYHHQVLKRRVKQEYEGVPCWFVSLEDQVILKLLFHRSKDIGDIKGLLATHSSKIDRAYIINTLSSLLGSGDSRLNEIKELFTRYTI